MTQPPEVDLRVRGQPAQSVSHLLGYGLSQPRRGPLTEKAPRPRGDPHGLAYTACLRREDCRLQLFDKCSPYILGPLQGNNWKYGDTLMVLTHGLLPSCLHPHNHCVAVGTVVGGAYNPTPPEPLAVLGPCQDIVRL